MNVLVIGSGGREHVLCWKIAQSPLVDKIFIAPGNGGTEQVGINLDIDPTNFDQLKKVLLHHRVQLLVVGPEAVLVAGLADSVHADPELSEVKVIGPGKAGARLEGSKVFSKAFMERHGIPTGSAKVFTADNLVEGLSYLEELQPPYVLKADGLAGGKGVVIARDIEEARATLKDLINGRFGEASTQVLIEEFLQGIEVSYFVLTDGETYRLLPEAKDYKRIGEGDQGPNTGGMGAVSPVIFADREFRRKVQKRIIQPTIEGLKKESIPYTGFIFFGLMNVAGNPYVIEYNVRLGDPEAEAILPRLKTDLVALMLAAADGELIDTEVEFERYTAVTVMLVSEGYPGAYEKGKTIEHPKFKQVLAFHAGTRRQGGHLLTNGGRVLALTALGKNLGESVSYAMQAAEKVNWPGVNYRKDIGTDLRELGQ